MLPEKYPKSIVRSPAVAATIPLGAAEPAVIAFLALIESPNPSPGMGFEP